MINRLYKYILYTGLTAILVFAPLARGATTTRIWAIAPVLLVIYLLVFLWLWRINNQEQTTNNKLQVTSLDRPLLAFVILAVISFAFSIYKHDSFYALLRLIAYVGIFYLIVNNYTRRLGQYLIGLVICIGTGLSIYGLLQYFGFITHEWWVPNYFLSSTYVCHNHFTGYLELVIPVAIGVSMQGVRDKGKGVRVKFFIIGLALIIMIAAFIFAQSRGAWVSLGIALFVMALFLIKQKVLKKKTLFVLLLLIALVATALYLRGGLVSQRMESIAELTKGEASMNTRFAIWQGTAEMIYDNPLIGVGIGDFVWGFPRYRSVELALIRAHYAHNDYLHMAAEMGLLALPIMILLIVRIIRTGFAKGAHSPIVLGCTIGVLSLSLHGLVDFNFHIPANMIVFIIYAAIIMKENKAC